MDTLNELITRGITNSLQEDITVMNDIYEHPEFSTENDLEGIIFDYGNKIQSIREMARRLDIIVHDYDVYLKDELSYKLKKFKEKREKFRVEWSKEPKSRPYSRLGVLVTDRVINSENDFNNPSSTCNEDDRK